jgi:phage gpG-like protein
MSEGGIHVEVRATQTSEALRDLARQLGDRRVPNRQLAVQMSSWVARNFAAEGALNQPWAKLKPSTANSKVTKAGARRGYEHILVVTGVLRASFQKFGYDNDSATVGTAIPFAVYHEEGGGNLPARPMLPPPEQALRDAVDVYTNFISRARGQVNL